MVSEIQQCDVCIICALPEEARALLKVVRTQCERAIEECISPRYQYGYRFAAIKNDKDELLNLHISWLPRYGPQEMTLHLSRVLEECQPRIAIMTGICAGNARQVQLGDLVVAERTFTYDNGKFTIDNDSGMIHLHDTMTYQLDANILQFLELFDDWKPLVERLKHPTSPPESGLKRRGIRCHIKAMASGSAVRADHPFEDVRAPVRGTVAIDMEGAAFGLVMSYHPRTPWLVVKGVCDYADQDKNDAYHDYAARASALYALSFIRVYVTEQRLPIAGNMPFPSGAGNQRENKPSEVYRAKQNGPGTNPLAARVPDTYRLSSRPDPQHRPNPAPLSVPTPFGAPFPEVWNVPRRHNAFFTGRASALEHLVNNFRVVNDADMISPQAITGLGGMGKTQVAAEYAYRWRGNYQAVLWVRAETQESLLADFRTIADLLKLPRERWRDQASLIQCMQEWFRTRSDWLLIFDNADNPALLDPFLSQAARGHFLATTRAGAVVPLAQNTLTLKALEADDGALCILRRAGLLTEQKQLSAAHPADVDAARQLAQLMEGLPLALEQAGAYINDTECGVRGYRKLYGEFRKEIQPVPFGVSRDYSETVVSVWRISQSTVEQSNPAAAELLRLCAFLAPDGIPDEMVIAGADALGPVLKPVAANQFTLNMLISALRKYSLLNRDVDREMDLTRLSVHPIMQEVMVDEMDKRTQRLWAERAVRAVELASRSIMWPVLQSQARHCQRLIEQWHMTFAEAKRLLQWIEKNERLEKR